MPIEWKPIREVKKLDLKLELPKLIQDLLSVRGIETEEEIVEILSSSLKDLRSPYLLKDIDLAVNRIFESYKKQEKILLYGDFDLDGSSGLALLYDGLKSLGFENLDYYQPSRMNDGYGLHANLIQGFKDKGFHLIISVDLGITAFEAALEAKKHSIDLIITDHHQPKDDLPEAIAVVNPNRRDCESGLGHLCGAGVAYYLLLALKLRWEKESIKHNFDPKALLDLFIIGTLTDMVPIKKENRSLIKHGLVQFAKAKRPGLKALLERLGYLNRPISSQDLAIGIAPKLNALSRMEQGVLPIDIFLEKDLYKAFELVDAALKSNSDRKDYQKDAQSIADQIVEKIENKNYIFVYDQSFHKGIIGLVATNLMLKHQKPAFVASLNETGELMGSSRSPHEGINLLDALDKAKDILSGYGGHKCAAGFHLALSEVDAFSQRLDQFYSQFDFSGVITSNYDLCINFDEVNIELMSWLDKLQPFGVDFPTPIFYSKSVVVKESRELRGGHLRFQLSSGNKLQTALYFNPTKEIAKFNTGDLVDIAYEVQWNYFNGSKTIQALLKDMVRTND